MALGQRAVNLAYEVFDALGLKDIVSFPEDFSELTERERHNPFEERPYMVDKKADGYEMLFFFKKDPSPEFLAQWELFKGKVGNSPLTVKKYPKESEYTIFGWF